MVVEEVLWKMGFKIVQTYSPKWKVSLVHFNGYLYPLYEVPKMIPNFKNLQVCTSKYSVDLQRDNIVWLRTNVQALNTMDFIANDLEQYTINVKVSSIYHIMDALISEIQARDGYFQTFLGSKGGFDIVDYLQGLLMVLKKENDTIVGGTLHILVRSKINPEMMKQLEQYLKRLVHFKESQYKLNGSLSDSAASKDLTVSVIYGFKSLLFRARFKDRVMHQFKELMASYTSFTKAGHKFILKSKHPSKIKSNLEAMIPITVEDFGNGRFERFLEVYLALVLLSPSFRYKNQLKSMEILTLRSNCYHITWKMAIISQDTFEPSAIKASLLEFVSIFQDYNSTFPEKSVVSAVNLTHTKQLATTQTSKELAIDQKIKDEQLLFKKANDLIEKHVSKIGNCIDSSSNSNIKVAIEASFGVFPLRYRGYFLTLEKSLSHFLNVVTSSELWISLHTANFQRSSKYGQRPIRLIKPALNSSEKLLKFFKVASKIVKGVIRFDLNLHKNQIIIEGFSKSVDSDHELYQTTLDVLWTQICV